MVKKRTGVIEAGLALIATGLFLLSVSAIAEEKEQAGHPELTEQEMLIACSECHGEETPELTREWFASTHGIAMVKCYQCHGTFESLVVTPGEQACSICHVDKVTPGHTEDKICWECHAPHSFKTVE